MEIEGWMRYCRFSMVLVWLELSGLLGEHLGWSVITLGNEKILGINLALILKWNGNCDISGTFLPGGMASISVTSWISRARRGSWSSIEFNELLGLGMCCTISSGVPVISLKGKVFKEVAPARDRGGPKVGDGFDDSVLLGNGHPNGVLPAKELELVWGFGISGGGFEVTPAPPWRHF
ncbi:hypothetical protein PanWU01x14_143550 [Parasponia andersonii]|uniref:Uncharacterized protein n=1 Tax=Parasponia andersonii TaxID=3476 RepID=A0A2P5CKZ0_PARAD|nr:hypothetical protein PanWU01x14_143550 [Parasponia andersonii]